MLDLVQTLREHCERCMGTGIDPCWMCGRSDTEPGSCQSQYHGKLPCSCSPQEPTRVTGQETTVDYSYDPAVNARLDR